VELDEALTVWVREGLVPAARGLLDDPRVRLHVGDVAAYVPRFEGLDAVLLDVDNGPDFLVHRANAALYEREFLGLAAAALRPGGVLAVWSADPSDVLLATMRDVCGSCEEVRLPVRRGRHEFTYAIYLGRTERA